MVRRKFLRNSASVHRGSRPTCGTVPSFVRRLAVGISVGIRAIHRLALVFRATSSVVLVARRFLRGGAPVVHPSCSVVIFIGLCAGVCVVLRFVPRFCTLCSVVLFPSSRRRVILVWHSIGRRTCAHRFCTTSSVVLTSLSSVLRFARRFRMVAVCPSFLHSAGRHFRRRRSLRWSAFYLRCWRSSYHASSAGCPIDVLRCPSCARANRLCATRAVVLVVVVIPPWFPSLACRSTCGYRCLRPASRAHRLCTA